VVGGHESKQFSPRNLGETCNTQNEAEFNSMAKKGQRSSRREAEAGKRNLEAWLRENPSGGNLKHGIYSKTIHKRYSDLRTREGKTLQAIIDAIKEDIGSKLDARQNLILALIRSKLIVVMQIGTYLESTTQLIEYNEGKAPPVIAQTFPSYTKGLTQLLNELYGDDRIKGRKGITYEDVIESIKAKEAAR